MVILLVMTFKNSLSQVSCKNGVLKNFAKVKVKLLRRSLFLIKQSTNLHQILFRANIAGN